MTSMVLLKSVLYRNYHYERNGDDFSKGFEEIIFIYAWTGFDRVSEISVISPQLDQKTLFP